jgi:hypothetical protein
MCRAPPGSQEHDYQHLMRHPAVALLNHAPVAPELENSGAEAEEETG